MAYKSLIPPGLQHTKRFNQTDHPHMGGHNSTGISACICVDRRILAQDPR